MVDYGSFYVNPLPAQQNAFNNLAGSIQYKNAMQRQGRQDAMEQNALARRQRMEDIQFKQSQESAKLSDNEKKMQILEKQLDFLGRGLDSVTDEQSHQQFRNIVGRMVQSGMLSPMWAENIPQNYNPQEVARGKQLINSFRQQMKGEGFTLSEGQTRFDASGREIAKGGTKRPSSIESAIVQQFEGDPDKLLELYNAKNNKGIVIESDGKGGLTFTQGNIGGMQRKTTGNIEEKLVNSQEGLVRLSNIIQSFKPEYQQIPDRLGNKWTALKEKLNIGDISTEDRKSLEEFSAYRQDALNNINLYIKEITGAQMSEKEADRIRKGMPDSGEGIFDGDSPTEFKSKLVNIYKQTKSSVARYNYYLNQGISPDKVSDMVSRGMVVSLDQMEDIIDKRFEELQKQKPNADTKELLNQLKQEFGL